MTCPSCDGAGFILVCIDDICHGLGECIHGDGEEICQECGGEGEVWPDDYDEERD